MFSRTGTRHGGTSFALWIRMAARFRSTWDRGTLHDAIGTVAHQVARLVGFHAVRQPTDLVAHAIKPENRERFIAAQRAAAKSHRGGLIPDLIILRLYIPSSGGLSVTRTCDVKTVGYSERYYRASIPRGRAADIRAAGVPADCYIRARKVDASYNGWPYQRGGPPSPALTLKSLPARTRSFISFGCCHGSDQAHGVIASFVRRTFGRISLRGVARIRQTALAAILGEATRADSSATWRVLWRARPRRCPAPSCKLEAGHHRGSWR